MALYESRQGRSPISSFTIGVNAPEQKRKNATGRRSPETHFLNGSKNSKQPPMGSYLLTPAAQNIIIVILFSMFLMSNRI